jgi:sulfide:quinone oxidoreductase
MAEHPRTVVILGGGTGGLVAANRLRRMLPKVHRIVLVSRSPYYTYEPALTSVMLGKRGPLAIMRDLRSLQRKGIDLVVAEVREIDTSGKRVQANEAWIEYDYLVIALGVDYSSAEVPGLNKAWTFYHPEGAEGLRDELERFRSGRVALLVPAMPYKCPPALYEGAMLLDALFRKQGIRERVEMAVYTPDAAPLSIAGSGISGRVLKLLDEREIAFTGGVTTKSINQEKRTINFADGTKADFDLLVATPVHNLPHVLETSGLAGHDGWVAANPEQLHTVADNVYAVGDCTGISIGDGYSLPKAGVFAHGQAEVVARNITAEIGGRDPIWVYGGQGACFMETGGGKGSYISGDYYSQPPEVSMKEPGRLWHWAKAGFERVWLWRWF